MKTSEKIKTFTIKVPVFTSEPTQKPIDIFGGVTYDDMINSVIKKIDEYNHRETKISKNKRNKTQTKEIENINYEICSINGTTTILLGISAYNTNLHDGYIETNTRFSLQKNHKIGSQNNFVLLYPNIYGLDKNNYIYHWIILLYEDPHKNDGLDFIATAKLVLNKILNISTANIKLPEIINEIKKIKTVPELKLKFTSLKFEDNEVDIKYRDYLVNSCIKAQKHNTFMNMPFSDTEDIINDNSFTDEYQKKEVKITIGKKEYKITKEFKDAKEEFKQTLEHIFNASLGITEEELETNIYQKDFILTKLELVLNNYLNSTDFNG